MTQTGAQSGTPFEEQLRAAGARFTLRDGRAVAADFGSVSTEVAVCRRAVGIADVSQLGKLRVHAPAQILHSFVGHGDELGVGAVVHSGEGWWGRTAEEDLLAVVAPALTARVLHRLEQDTSRRPASSVTDDTGTLAALVIVGPKAAPLLERLGAGRSADAVRPTQDAAGIWTQEVDGVEITVLAEAADRFVLLFLAGAAARMWGMVLHLGEPMGASCVGATALSMLDAAEPAPRRPLMS